jgi:ankyrin repeat protein
LDLAVVKGDEAGVRLLLAHKANINEKDGYGLTALHQTAGKVHEAVVWLLLGYKADVNVKDDYGAMVLCQAAYKRARGGGHFLEANIPSIPAFLRLTSPPKG